MAQARRGWDFDLEEGLLDPARLHRVATDPVRPPVFKRERGVAFRDTVVTLLLDNSGSMRGRPILIAATCADILTRTLERCGVKTEVLGFTTAAWKGGRPYKGWVRAKRPAHPGRLNELRHIICSDRSASGASSGPLRRAGGPLPRRRAARAWRAARSALLGPGSDRLTRRSQRDHNAVDRTGHMRSKALLKSWP
jgi:cobaltochelatase CobT subunit